MAFRRGALRPESKLMLAMPAQISKEWRLWAVDGRIVAYSLYKEGVRVVYRQEIDDDALQFAQRMIGLNPGYARAYVIDICRTADGLRKFRWVLRRRSGAAGGRDGWPAARLKAMSGCRQFGRLSAR